MALAISKDSILAFRNPNFQRSLLFDKNLAQLPVNIKLKQNERGDHLFFHKNDLYVWGGAADARQSRIEKVNIKTGKSEWVHPVYDTTNHIAFSNNGSTLAVGSGMHKIDLLDVTSGKLKSQFTWNNRCENTVFDILGFSSSDESLFLNCSEKISEISIETLLENTLVVEEWFGYNFWIQDNTITTFNNHSVDGSLKLSLPIRSIFPVMSRFDGDVVLSSHKKHALFLNNPSKDEYIIITVVDVASGETRLEYCMHPSGYVYGLAVDDTLDRLFVELSTDKVFWFDMNDIEKPAYELQIDD